jgi:hypothetical protein
MAGWQNPKQMPNANLQMSKTFVLNLEFHA